MLIRGKKGETGDSGVREAIKYLALAALVIIILFQLYGALNDNTLYFKNYYSKDIALLLETMHAGQGKINLNYVFKEEPVLDMTVENGIVTLYAEGKLEDISATSFQYGKDNLLETEHYAGTPFKIAIRKENAIKIENNNAR